MNEIKKEEDKIGGIHWHDISGEAWKRIKELLFGQAGKYGEWRKTAYSLMQ